MKIELIDPCDGPRCQAGATHIIRLDNDRTVAQVCERHLSWGKKRAKEIENS